MNNSDFMKLKVGDTVFITSPALIGEGEGRPVIEADVVDIQPWSLTVSYASRTAPGGIEPAATWSVELTFRRRYEAEREALAIIARYLRDANRRHAEYVGHLIGDAALILNAEAMVPADTV